MKCILLYNSRVQHTWPHTAPQPYSALGIASVFQTINLLRLLFGCQLHQVIYENMKATCMSLSIFLLADKVPKAIHANVTSTLLQQSTYCCRVNKFNHEFWLVIGWPQGLCTKLNCHSNLLLRLSVLSMQEIASWLLAHIFFTLLIRSLWIWKSFC